MLVAAPGAGGAALKLSQFFRYAVANGSRRARIWMPATTVLADDSPWQPLLHEGWIQQRPLSNPELLLLSDAADWQAAARLYGSGHQGSRLQLLWGSDLRSWGHGALRQPAIRVAMGSGIGQALATAAPVREPIHTLPIGLDPEDLVPLLGRPLLGQSRTCDVVLLAQHNPALGLAIQAQLQQRGLSCRTELTPWPLQQALRAMGQAGVAVVLSPPAGQGSLGLLRLAAMALQVPLVCDQREPDDGLCQHERNAWIGPADAAALAAAASLLLEPTGSSLRRRLIDGGLGTLVRHRRARERLEFETLLDALRQHWQQACHCHSEAMQPAAPAR